MIESPTWSAVRATSSSVAFSKTPAISTRRRKAAAMEAASVSRTRRGERGTKIRPSAHGLCSTHVRASSRDVMPQSLTRVTRPL
jgi:hypothetical protein